MSLGFFLFSYSSLFTTAKIFHFIMNRDFPDYREIPPNLLNYYGARALLDKIYTEGKREGKREGRVEGRVEAISSPAGKSYEFIWVYVADESFPTEPYKMPLENVQDWHHLRDELQKAYPKWSHLFTDRNVMLLITLKTKYRLLAHHWQYYVQDGISVSVEFRIGTRSYYSLVQRVQKRNKPKHIVADAQFRLKYYFNMPRYGGYKGLSYYPDEYAYLHRIPPPPKKKVTFADER